MNRDVVLLLTLLVPAWGGELRLGSAAVIITPPEGMPMAGYYYNRAAEGVHDDLYAKALVLEQDGDRAALVACDLASISRPIVEEARRLIEKSTGIAAGRVMISATHCHTGPVLVGRSTRDDQMPAPMLRIASKYVADLPSKIAESVARAAAGLRSTLAWAGTGHEDSLAFNRRFHMKDGTVGWNPGKLNPGIVKPAGPIDPDVAVVYFEATDAVPLATYVNYAMHLDTVGGQQFSADFPYTLSTLLGKVKGSGMLTLFTIGTAGNVNHIDVSTKAPQKGNEEAARIGTVLAGEVLRTYKRMKPVESVGVKARSRIVQLPLPEIGPGELEKAREVAPKYGKPNAAPFMDLVQAFKVIDVSARAGKPLEAEVQVIALGNQVAWVGLPGEIFVELGMALKKASPFPFTIVAELANGSVGYVPNRKAYPEGNYEVVSARCAAGSGEMLVDAALDMLKELR